MTSLKVKSVRSCCVLMKGRWRVTNSDVMEAARQGTVTCSSNQPLLYIYGSLRTLRHGYLYLLRTSGGTWYYEVLLMSRCTHEHTVHSIALQSLSVALHAVVRMMVIQERPRLLCLIPQMSLTNRCVMRDCNPRISS